MRLVGVGAVGKRSLQLYWRPCKVLGDPPSAAPSVVMNTAGCPQSAPAPAAIAAPTWCRCREMMRNSPTALRLLKSALNAAEDGQAGIQQLGGDATLLFYQSEEGNEVGAWVRGGWKWPPGWVGRRPGIQLAVSGHLRCVLAICITVAAPGLAGSPCAAGAAVLHGQAGPRLLPLQAAALEAP